MSPEATYTEEKGLLPDGTEYLIRVPTDWNEVLVRDLDFASGADNPERMDRFKDMLSRGYAVAGTARHRLRQWQYDPIREIKNLDLVIELFEKRWGTPRRIIQYGCSGGGHVALSVAEAFHDRIDGSIAMGTHTPVWLMNSFLDGWFVLQTLLTEHYVDAGLGPAEDLRITELPNDGSANPNGHGLGGKLPEAWRNAFQAANKSPEGRARMALAFAIGQWCPWLAFDDAEPDLEDIDALQESIFLSAMQVAQSPGGEARILFENAAQGQQLSWNDGIDYAGSLENAAPVLRTAAEELYAKSGATLAGDLERLDAAPRISASDYALKHWKQPGRTIYGKPEIPVLRLHVVGDFQVPYSLVQGYADTIEANGKGDMAKIAYARSTGHCNFSTAESAAAIETLMQRIETGEWPDTSPDGLNALAESLQTGTQARFMDIGPYRVARFNRTWLPE